MFSAAKLFAVIDSKFAVTVSNAFDSVDSDVTNVDDEANGILRVNAEDVAGSNKLDDVDCVSSVIDCVGSACFISFCAGTVVDSVVGVGGELMIDSDEI